MLELQNEMEQMQSLLYTSNESVVSKKKLHLWLKVVHLKVTLLGVKILNTYAMFIVALIIDNLCEIVHVLSFK